MRKWLSVGAMLAVFVSVAGAQNTSDDGKEPWEEAERRVGASRKVDALGPSLFGDQVSNSNGALSFSITDVSVPGNNDLPVAVTRTFNVENRAAESPSGQTGYASDYMFADWDLDIPQISGVFAPDWTVGSGQPLNRCSSSAIAAAPALQGTGILAHTWWSGNTVKLFAGGGELLLNNAGAPAPTDGGAYPWVTPDLAYVSCLPAVQNAAGEGFLAVDRNGVKYYFDWMAQYKEPVIRHVTLYEGSYEFGGPVSRKFNRRRNVLYPTRIVDRFGNSVTYTWTNPYNSPGKLTRIESSDGRIITLAYNILNQVSQVSTSGRAWTYAYTPNGAQTTLNTVTQPDSSRWLINFSELANTSLRYTRSTPQNPERTCLGGGDPIGQTQFTGSVTHPSGAVGNFTVKALQHGRTNVPLTCEGFVTPVRQVWAERARIPFEYFAYSLIQKTLSGPGISTQAWNYSYAPQISYAYPAGSSYGRPICTSSANCDAPLCTSDSCAGTTTTTIAGPGGEVTRFTYGNSYLYNEGKLLKVEHGTAAGMLRTQQFSFDLSRQDQVYKARWGSSLRPLGDGFTAEYHRPQVSTTVQQDGATFQSTNTSFDAFARPVSVTRQGPSGSVTDVRQYHDDQARWILGQSARLTNSNTGAVVSQTTFDGNAMPVQISAFGKLQKTLAYNADGTLASVTDGRNNVTRLAAWKRGVPQSVTFADGTVVSGTVDDNGWIGSVTDANGFATGYGYDAMGRLASVAYPAGDSVNWNVSTQSFSKVNAVEYGLAAGHWKQVVATGNGRKETYMDAYWRPVVTREYDAANVGATERFQRFAYDQQGNQVFASYPGASDALSAGTWTEYDPIGRVSSSSQDSELGLLTTLTHYLSGGKMRVTNARGQQTITEFQAFDQPDYERPISIQHPEGAFTDITRDVFGKPISIRRRNAGGTESVTRRYVYDAQQQLCKSIEPEAGATAMGYDTVGNIIWSASGLNLSSATSCDAAAAYDSGRRVSRTYDVRNRVSTLAFPDGRGNQTWTYTPDGQPAQIVTQNEVGLAQTTNAYSYNKRRLLTGESTAQSDGETWALGYGYDANGTLAGLTYPSGRYIDFSPNGLGQPTRAGTYATAVSYFPNGGMRQFTYGNGLVHTMTQNARQLPARVIDGGGALDNAYTYDAVGNVSAITDALDAQRNRSMVYDGLDRLTQASSVSFQGDGILRYTYDTLDNLRSVHLGGQRDNNYLYDANNRLTNIRNDAGSTTTGLAYDVQGNLANKNGQVFQFDYGNRLRQAIGLETYRYDGHGRRVLANNLSTGRVLSMYGNDGVLRRQHNERTGKTQEYINLNGSLVAEVSVAVTLAAPVLTVPSYSQSGTYTVSWTASTNATRYELESNLAGGAWSAAYNGTGRTYSASAQGAGVRSYRVRGCQGTTCGAWSPLATISVAVVPGAAPTITVPVTGLNGSFRVSWSMVAAATSYQLEESVGAAAWTQVYAGGALGANIEGRAAGSIRYRVSACNATGCSAASSIGTVTVIHPPVATPALSLPGTSTTGSYTLSWTAVATASTYGVEQRFNGGIWTEVQNASATSQNYSGKPYGTYEYRVRACNAAGCAAYSGTATVAVILVPASAPVITVPAGSASGGYTVSWSAIGGAVEYRLEEQINGGGWTQIHNEGATQRGFGGRGSATYGYRVRACNLAGCSGYSETRSITVLVPPQSAPVVSVPATSTTGEFTVSWNAVTDGAYYVLDQQENTNAWREVYSGGATRFDATARANGTWKYRVKACNGNGCSPLSAIATLQVQPAPLPTPTGLTVRQATRVDCRVTWNPVPGATWYDVMSRGYLIESGPQTQHRFDAKCVNPYKVRACNAQVCSTWSNEESG